MNDSLPSTIYNPQKFSEKLPAGFDGVFDWSWTAGCFGDTRIEPMDIDGLVERRGNFLVFETKEHGKQLPTGQRIVLETLYRTGHFTVLLIWGKREPEIIELWHPALREPRVYEGVDKARQVVARWFAWADNNPQQRIDHTLLNRRVQALRKKSTRMAQHMKEAAELLDRAMREEGGE